MIQITQREVESEAHHLQVEAVGLAEDERELPQQCSRGSSEVASPEVLSLRGRQLNMYSENVFFSILFQTQTRTLTWQLRDTF